MQLPWETFFMHLWYWSVLRGWKRQAGSFWCSWEVILLQTAQRCSGNTVRAAFECKQVMHRTTLDMFLRASQFLHFIEHRNLQTLISHYRTSLHEHMIVLSCPSTMHNTQPIVTLSCIRPQELASNPGDSSRCVVYVGNKWPRPLFKREFTT